MCVCVWCSCCFDPQVHLDANTKKEVYQEYRLSLMQHAHSWEQEILSYKSFVRLWNNHYRWLKLRRHKTIKSKCSICEDLEVGATTGQRHDSPNADDTHDVTNTCIPPDGSSV